MNDPPVVSLSLVGALPTSRLPPRARTVPSDVWAVTVGTSALPKGVLRFSDPDVDQVVVTNPFYFPSDSLVYLQVC